MDGFFYVGTKDKSVPSVDDVGSCAAFAGT